MYFGNLLLGRNMVKESKYAGPSSIATLLNLADTGSPGPTPSFVGPHILLAFLNVADSSYIGRKPLAMKSGLGEGAARSVLLRLRKKGFVDVIRSGCFLTRSGKRLASSIGSTMSGPLSIPNSSLTMGEYQAALTLRGMAVNLHSGIEQRDSAIRIGALGATTYMFESGRFKVPGGSSDCEKDFPSPAWSALKKGLAPNNRDVVILCGAGSEVGARLGAIAAAVTLL